MKDLSTLFVQPADWGKQQMIKDKGKQSKGLKRHELFLGQIICFLNISKPDNP